MNKGAHYMCMSQRYGVILTKWLNRSRCCLGYGLGHSGQSGVPKELCFRWDGVQISLTEKGTVEQESGLLTIKHC